AVDDAFWLEMKVIHQYAPGCLDQPNPRYSAQFLSVTRGDLSKLAKDEAILHAGLLLVLFTADEATARADLRTWHERCVHRALPLAAPSQRFVPITNRPGHGLLPLALARVRHLCRPIRLTGPDRTCKDCSHTSPLPGMLIGGRVWPRFDSL